MVSLRIWVDESHYSKIENILGIKPTKDNLCAWWIYETESGWIYKTENTNFFYIDYFLSILEGKYEQLKQIGVERDDISIWWLYDYDGQCNMEFLPEHMYKLGKEGITLCVTCVDIHDYDEDCP